MKIVAFITRTASHYTGATSMLQHTWTHYACNGYPGGPLVDKENGKPRCLIGVSSFNAERCDNPNYSSVFTAAAVFKTWIEAQVTFKVHEQLHQ